MTLARDTFLESATFTTTTPHTFTYTPVGTPRGVVLFVIYPSVTDLITGTVSYGGVAMTRIPTNGHAAVTTEAGSVVGYTLGTGIPTGAQTVSIGHTGSADVKIAYVATLTAAADTEIAVSGKQVQEADDDPQVVLDSGADSALRYCGLFGGEDAAAAYAVMAGMETAVAGSSHDFGANVAHLGQQTSPATGSFTIGYASTGAESTAIIGVAFKEVAGGTGHTASQTDPEGLLDDATLVAEYVRSEDNPLGLVDSATLVAAYERSDDDALGLVDTVAVVAELNVTITDPLGMVDDGEWFEVAPDVLGLTDSVSYQTSGGTGHTATFTDPLGLVDDITVDSVFAHEVVVTDSLGLTDSTSTVAAYELSVSDLLGLVDSVTTGLSGLTFWTPNPVAYDPITAGDTPPWN